MQIEAARRLRETVTPCPEDKHQWVKEYFNGANTGDYVCSICGTELSGPDYEKMCKK
nr:MAG TPA_asm: Rad50 zinc hook motif [Caudoviricetes sp.]